MLSNKGYLKKKTIFKSNKRFKINCIEEMFDMKIIHKMEKEVWGNNSDPDFDDIPLWKCYTIENANYILAYAIISKRYFYDNEEVHFTQIMVNDLSEIKIALDFEDLVVINNRAAMPYITELIDKMFEEIVDANPDYIILNPNSNSRPLLKRLKALNLPIKYHRNYPAYLPSDEFNSAHKS